MDLRTRYVLPVARARRTLHTVLERILGCKIVHLPSGDWFITRNEVDNLLAVQANNNLSWPLTIGYVFNGCGQGELSLCLHEENGPVVFQTTRRLEMPCEWRLAIDSEANVNGTKVSVQEIHRPRNDGWLISEITFTGKDQRVLKRRIRHRFLTGEKTLGERYFNGGNYRDYAIEASSHGIRILKLLQRYREINSILDIGCATGILLSDAKASGMRVEGIDVSAWAVAEANRRLQEHVCRAMDIDLARRADFDQIYDAVVLNNVLEHVKYPARLLELAASLLQRGGLLYCGTLNANSWFHKILGRNWVGYSDPSHESPWLTATWLRDAVRGSGFDLLEFQISNYLWTENTCDPATQDLCSLFTTSRAGQLLKDGGGDTVELLARRNS